MLISSAYPFVVCASCPSFRSDLDSTVASGHEVPGYAPVSRCVGEDCPMSSRMRSALDVSTSSAVFSGSSPRVYCNPSPTWGFEKLPVEGSPYPTAVRSLDRLGLLVVATPLRPGVSSSRKAGFPANTRGQGLPASASRSGRLMPEPYMVTGFPVVVVSHDPVRTTRSPKSAGRIASSSHGPKPGGFGASGVSGG